MKAYRIDYTENTDNGWPCQYTIHLKDESLLDAITCFDRDHPLAWNVHITEVVQ
jgi:hypothetical protein